MMGNAESLPSAPAETAMRRFDEARLGRLKRARIEGMVSLGISVVLSIVAFFLSRKGTSLGLGTNAIVVITDQCCSIACVLAWLSVLRIFQAAGLGPSSRIGAVADHTAILLATFYVVWFLAKVAAIWQ